MDLRFLAARSEMGYVESPVRALRREPAAVSEAEQLAFTEQARRRAFDERVRRREATADEIVRELGHLESRCQFLRRQLKRLHRQV